MPPGTARPRLLPPSSVPPLDEISRVVPLSPDIAAALLGFLPGVSRVAPRHGR